MFLTSITKRFARTSRVKSPWLLHYDCGSCNGCDIEILACLTPLYDVERFGIVNVGNPKHADILLVTGPANRRNQRVLRNLYDQMPGPKAVIAVGTCASSGGVFNGCYNILGGVDRVIPVDVYVPGCAARPEAIIDGVVMALGKLAEGGTAKATGAAETSGREPVSVAVADASGRETGIEAAAETSGRETAVKAAADAAAVRETGG